MVDDQTLLTYAVDTVENSKDHSRLLLAFELIIVVSKVLLIFFLFFYFSTFLIEKVIRFNVCICFKLIFHLISILGNPLKQQGTRICLLTSSN